jgi:antitoxin MazE
MDIHCISNGVKSMKVKISKWGNSLGVRLPRAAVDATGLGEGAQLELEIDGRELRLKPAYPVKRYRLEDLVAEMKPENQPELVDWGPDVGAEVIDDAYSRGEITLEDIVSRKDAPRRR